MDQMVLQSLLNGLVIGSIYILVALGLTLLYGVLHILNFAHGELYMLGAFSVYYVTEVFGLNYFLGILVGALLCAVIGIAAERTLLRPLRGDWLILVIAGIGLSRIMIGASWQIFGTVDKSVAPMVVGVIRFLGTSVSAERLMAAGLGLLAIGVLYWFVKSTRSGMALRAIEQDSEMARLMGVNTNKLSALTVIIGFSVAAISGAIMAPIFTISPAMGEQGLFKAFVIIIVGGLGSIRGCIVAGLLLGLIDSFGATLFGAQIANMISFSLVIIILIFRPEGIGMRRV